MLRKPKILFTVMFFFAATAAIILSGCGGGGGTDTLPGAPTVLSTSPSNTATGVAVNSTITATFSTAMLPSSITPTTFTVMGVTGTVAYSGTTATFTPSTNLASATTFTAKITTGAKDSAGNPLAAPFSWSFTTGTVGTVSSRVTKIAVGGGHTIVLKSDGTVWTWGYNGFGQLGDGTTTNRTTPVQVSGLTGVTAIATGGYHTVALKNDGTVWVWGGNQDAELGNVSRMNSLVPIKMNGL